MLAIKTSNPARSAYAAVNATRPSGRGTRASGSSTETCHCRRERKACSARTAAAAAARRSASVRITIPWRRWTRSLVHKVLQSIVTQRQSLQPRQLPDWTVPHRSGAQDCGAAMGSGDTRCGRAVREDVGGLRPITVVLCLLWKDSYAPSTSAGLAQGCLNGRRTNRCRRDRTLPEVLMPKSPFMQVMRHAGTG